MTQGEKRREYGNKVVVKKIQYVPSVVFVVKNLHEVVHPIVPDAGHDPVRVRQRQLEDAIFNLNLRMQRSLKKLQQQSTKRLVLSGRQAKAEHSHIGR
jgi:hypothetical protein